MRVLMFVTLLSGALFANWGAFAAGLAEGMQNGAVTAHNNAVREREEQVERNGKIKQAEYTYLKRMEYLSSKYWTIIQKLERKNQVE